MKRMHWVLGLGIALTGISWAAAPGRFRDVPEKHWAQREIAAVASKGVMPPKKPGAFQPEQTVTRAELASILTRLIDYLENRGPQKISQSPAKPHVLRRQRDALARLPKKHPSYPAMKRLVEGGYLVPNIHGDFFMPTAQNLDRPVTQPELALALAGVSIRVTEKRVAVEHPESLREGYRLGPDEERPTVPRGQKPAHDHGHGRPQPR